MSVTQAAAVVDRVIRAQLKLPAIAGRIDGETEQRQLDAAIAAARPAIPAGAPGECDDCGQMMPRLVGGRCGYCRDGRR